MASLGALALAAASSAGASGGELEATTTGEPAAAVGGSSEEASRESPACSSRNTIAFRGLALYRVRHFGRMRCRVPTLIRCASRLLDLDGEAPELISRERARGRRRCAFDSAPSERLYEITHPFRERFAYRITLTRRKHVWSRRTREVCPKVSPDRKTLTCRASHETVAPFDSTVTSG